MKRYQVVVKGRELVAYECDLYDEAKAKAEDLARTLAREARVYRTEYGTYGRPVYRTGTKSDERF